MIYKILELLKEHTDNIDIKSIYLKLQCVLLLPSETIDDINLRLVLKDMSILGRENENKVLYHFLPLPEALASELVEYREAVRSDELLLFGKKYTLREAYKYLLACPFLTNVHDQIDCDVLCRGLSLEYQIGYVLDKQVAFGIINKEFVDVFYSRVDTLEYQFGKYSCFNNGQYQRSIREVQKKILNHKLITYE